MEDCLYLIVWLLLIPRLTLQMVRVVTYDGIKWMVDPMPSQVQPFWKLWVLERKSLERLQWDPGGFFWMDPFVVSQKEVGFF